ncbi:MAG: DNA methyltransferase [Bacteroidota bacterium]
MRTPQIIEWLIAHRKLRLSIEDGQLNYAARPGVMTPAIKNLLRQHKEALMERLRSSEPQWNPGKAKYELLQGDCQTVLKGMPAESVDCIITDPPYGLKFMGKDWDRTIPDAGIWEECLRVLKPGAFAFIMCSPRQDLLARMIINIESAGFVTGFSPIYWTYASGFSKRHNISKAVDKELGVEQEILQKNPNSRENCNKSNTIYKSGTVGKTAYITKPKTEQAKKLKGAYAGFQPKPAVEVILVAMKPREETSYTKQAMVNGKGVTWLDDCRIPHTQEERSKEIDLAGRVPANLLVSDDVLDGEKYSKFFSIDAWAFQNLPFLIANKASRKEKNTGLESFEEKIILGRDFGQDQRNNPYKIRPVKRHNLHPSVKPIALMAYLVTLGSREGDLVLDPFCGTGTTGIASVILNRRSVGIEIDGHYCKIAEQRLRYYEEKKSRLN